MEIVREFKCALTGIECIIFLDKDTNSEICVEKPQK